MGNEYFSISTQPLTQLDDEVSFEQGENRVTIFSKTPFIKDKPTADSYTSVCAETVTAFGPLIIYGTIIGYLGGRTLHFKSDLEKQTLDLTHLSKQRNICFAGDLNISFAGTPYPSTMVVKNVAELFDNLGLTIITKDCEDSAIHGMFSNTFLKNFEIKQDYMVFDKKITDHRLVTITLTPKDVRILVI